MIFSFHFRKIPYTLCSKRNRILFSKISLNYFSVKVTAFQLATPPFQHTNQANLNKLQTFSFNRNLVDILVYKEKKMMQRIY